MEKYLLTAALPYANGDLHFGHLCGAYIPADIYSRHKRLVGHKVKFICGSDEHGVAIMLGAKKAGLSYQEYVNRWYKSHLSLFKKFNISFDFFGRTSSSYHREEVTEWFKEIYDKGFIEEREEKQLFCNDCKNHLPDRFVVGGCYSCGHKKARGDECPKCGIWIEAAKLTNPICQICESSNVTIVKVSQYYLLLSKYHKEFRIWMEGKKELWRKTVWPFVDSLTKKSLHDRAITRDLDWGIDVPLKGATGKKLYVWFDAPIGYVSNLKKHLEENGEKEHYLDDWFNNKDVKIENFIGKDNIIFHCIIFPVMSMVSKRAAPVFDVPANQYLNLTGKQFSKSEGIAVDMEEALKLFGADTLRYYLISIMPEMADSSFTWDDFAAKINGELANNIGNLVSRCLKFMFKNWPDGIDVKKLKKFKDSKMGEVFIEGIKRQGEYLDNKQFKKGLEQVMGLGHAANDFFTKEQPWDAIKKDKLKAEEIIAHTAQMILILGVLLSVYLPEISKNITSFFGKINEENKRKIYKGDLSALDELMSKKFQIKIAPGILISKIDEKTIDKLNSKLKG